MKTFILRLLEKIILVELRPGDLYLHEYIYNFRTDISKCTKRSADTLSTGFIKFGGVYIFLFAILFTTHAVAYLYMV